MTIFFYALLAQVVVAVIVIAILRALLENMLLDLGVRQLEYWLSTEGKTVTTKTVTVITHRILKAVYAQRVQKAAARFWGETGQVVFLIEPLILGGMIVDVGSRRFDCSLKDRLQQAFPKR